MTEKREKADRRFQDIKAMYDNGMTISEIGRHYGISKQRVSQLFHERNIVLRSSIPDSEIVRIADPELVSKAFGIAYWTARSRLKKLGYTFARKPHPRHKWSKERIEALWKDYESGLTQKQLGEKHGVHQTIISYILRREGFPTRLRGRKKGANV